MAARWRADAVARCRLALAAAGEQHQQRAHDGAPATPTADKIPPATAIASPPPEALGMLATPHLSSTGEELLSGDPFVVVLTESAVSMTDTAISVAKAERFAAELAPWHGHKWRCVVAESLASTALLGLLSTYSPWPIVLVRRPTIVA